MFDRSVKPSSPPSPVSIAPLSQAPARPDRSFVSPSAASRAGAALSQGVSIKGDVTFRNGLVIDGEVEGTIRSTGNLTIGQHAKIKADITAGSVVIHGKVEGNVTATERCALEAGASLRGDIESPRLAMHDESTFMGHAKITSKGA